MPLVLLVFLLSLVVVRTHSQETASINVWYGTTLQICGGLLLLNSIDKNLRGFKNKTIPQHLAEWFVTWIKAIPWGKKPISVSITENVRATTGVSAIVRRARTTYHTIDERVEALKRQRHLNYRN
jgi:hypothetical protein